MQYPRARPALPPPSSYHPTQDVTSPAAAMWRTTTDEDETDGVRSYTCNDLNLINYRALILVIFHSL